MSREVETDLRPKSTKVKQFWISYIQAGVDPGFTPLLGHG